MKLIFLIFALCIAVQAFREFEFNLGSKAELEEFNGDEWETFEGATEAYKYTWKNCGSPQNDMLYIKDLKLTPEMPVGKKDLTIKLVGRISKSPSKAATVKYFVKKGPITLVKGEENFCKMLNEVPEAPKCPLPVGDMTFEITKRLPTVPAGLYKIDLEGKDGSSRMFCINMEITFGRA